MYGSTEELFFLNNDYGGPYWDKQNATAMRTYANSPHKFVDKWDTPIMIITGELDFRIPYTQSLEAFTAARLHGIDARLVEFEDEDHQVMKPQNSVVWNREFFGWLDKYLKKIAFFNRFDANGGLLPGRPPFYFPQRNRKPLIKKAYW